MWKFYALLSALFAAPAAILAKTENHRQMEYVFLMIIAFLFLKEPIDWKPIVGRTLIAAGAITLIL